MKRFQRIITAGLLVAATVGPSGVKAGCLQDFSCQLYGECRLPCLDQLMGHTSPPAAAVAPATAQAASPPIREMADSPAAGPAPHREVSPNLAKKRSATAHLAYLRIVAAPGIGALADLAGKPVSFGPDGDVSQTLGRKTFAALGIEVEETPLDFDNALDGVGSGDVAAVVVLHPRDVAKLHALPPGGPHLLAMPAGTAPPAGLSAAVLPPTAGGPLEGRPLRTFAVDTRTLPSLAKRVASVGY